MNQEGISRLFSKLVMVVGCAVFAATLSASPASAKKKGKRAPKITWEQCCEQNGNDTAKCSKMKNVKGKKEKKGKKFVAKTCPEVAPVEEPLGGDLEDDSL